MLRTRFAPAVAACVAAVVFATAAHAGPPGSTVMLTRPAGFGALTPPVVNDSSFSAFGIAQHAGADYIADPSHRVVGGPSSTNRYTVFVSRADGLVGNDNDAVDNVYVRDGVNNTTTLVSRATDGTPANGSSGEPAISADGRYVVFSSTATNLVTGIDTNQTSQVYERDLVAGTTTLISRADGAAGAVGNGSSFEPSVGVNGGTVVVAFSSVADNLGGGTDEQVYVRSGNSTSVASVKSGTTTPGNSTSFQPSLSDDGKVVAFTTYASDIGVSDTNGAPDVFIHNLQTGTTSLVSVETIAPSPGAYGNSASSGPSISSDGHRVAFTSTATNLAALDSAGDPDVYIHDFNTNSTGLASQGGGAKATGTLGSGSYNASISADGVKIAFTTDAGNLYGGDTNGVADVYVNNTGFGGGTSLGSRCQGAALLSLPATEGAIAPNGTSVSFATQSRGCSPQADPDFDQVYLHGLGLAPVGVELTSWISRPDGTGAFQSGTDDSAFHGASRDNDAPSSLSADGSVAAFVSEADEMSADDDNRYPNVFVRDAKAGTTELISRASGAAGDAANGPSGPALHLSRSGTRNVSPPAISANGRFVAFTSAADNLVSGDSNGHVDVFVRDRVAQTTTIVSVKTDGSQVAADSYDPDISADGSRVAFVSEGVLDPANDTFGKRSVYVRDLAAGTTTLASHQTDGPGTFDANEDAVGPSISGDGTHVSFVTKSTNLAGPADANGVEDVYVRDLVTKQTSLGSTRDGMLTASSDGAISGDLDFTGTHLAFTSKSNNLVGSADLNGVTDIYLRDLGQPKTTLISQGPGGAAGNAASSEPSISGDGNRVAFATHATDLLTGGSPALSSVMLRDVAAATTTLVSRADGAGGAAADEPSAFPSISSDGHCVSFDSTADNLIAGPAGTDFTHGFMRAIDADCGTPPPPPGPPAQNDTTAPTLTGLKLSPAAFRAGAKRTAISAKKTPKGTKIRFTLSEAAGVSLKIERRLAGHRKGKKCLARRTTGRRCTLYRAAGTLRRSGRTGANTVAFSGRIGSKKLAKGRYRITAVATDAAGNHSARKRVTFRIVA